ncbi:cullin-3-A-like [Melanaphis sacchari]|uniref:Cullin-3-A n=1 Tax=Melanaphis sacchari TaxID=742174 RepID=A0A2H8U1C8_9HEMI|nr:cullin-3-A-like [Melanaphis sacchari]
MESNNNKLAEDIEINEHFNPDEILHVFVAAFSVEEKQIVSGLLLDDFKMFFLQMGASVVNINLHQKARFVSCFGYSSRVNFYNSVKMFIINHLQHEIKPNVLKSTNHIFLKSLTTAWENFFEALITINNVMDYMESIHSGHNKLEHFDKLGVILFRCMVFQNDEVQLRFQQCLSEMKLVKVREITLLNSDRLLLEGVSIMCNLLKMDSIYEGYVKPFFMRLTTEYFQTMSKDYLFQYCACVYFENVHAKIMEEMNRIQFKLDARSVNDINEVIKTELVKKNMKTIIEMENCGVMYLLKNNQYDDLRCMYNFLYTVDGGVKVMIDSMCLYFRELGTSVVLEKLNSDIISCVQSLLDLKEKFDVLFANVFCHDLLFDEIVGGEFGSFLKLNSLIPKFLSKFLDLMLRRDKSVLTKNNNDVNKIVFLIKNLQNKSDFETYYQIHFADRLLCYRYVNIRAENKMMNKVLSIFVDDHGKRNSLFVSRIEGMFKDKFITSKTSIQSYNEFVTVNKCILGILQPFDIDVEVINSVYWPVIDPKSICKVPAFALNVFNDFKKYYSKGETRKTLKLLPQFGTVELVATYYGEPIFLKRSHDGGKCSPVPNSRRVERHFKVRVTTYQMFVLDLFNTNDGLKFKEILKETMIPERSLINALRGLICFHRLLRKNPSGQEISANDEFYINESLGFQ